MVDELRQALEQAQRRLSDDEQRRSVVWLPKSRRG